MTVIPALDLSRQIGERRSLPDGGSQVWTHKGWRDAHSQEAREALSAAANDTQAGLHSIEAEQALLGCILMDGEQLEGLGHLSADTFHEPFHGRLFTAMRESWRAGRAIDVILTNDKLINDPALAELNQSCGESYLALLLDRAPPAVNAPDYAALLVDLATRRNLIRELGELALAAKEDRDRPAADIASEGERKLMEVASAVSTREAFLGGGDVVAMALEDAQTRAGAIEFTSGLSDLDALTNGYQRGELVIEAGRPSMGKSIRGLQIVRANAQRGKGSMFFSLEMATTPLGLRVACDVTYDPERRFAGREFQNPTMDGAMKNRLSTAQRQMLVEAAHRVAEWPMLFDPRPGLTVAEIERCARRAIRTWERRGIEPGPIVVDHLTIIRPDRERSGNKVAETGDISRALAEMAKRLNVPVIALCQLSRALESREDKRPTLADLRWSGEIEQDARQVTFIHRPEYFLRDPMPGKTVSVEQEIEREAARNKMLLLVAKNNNGPIGQVDAFCDVACSVVRDQGAVR